MFTEYLCDLPFFCVLQFDTYVLTVAANDNGQPEINSTLVTVVIYVFSQTNFFAPNLTEAAYTGSIDENSPPGTPILTIAATDADIIGPAAQISTFILEGEDAVYFRIENQGNNTGILKAK